MALSSNNSYWPRAFFEAPLLTPEECQQILDLAYEAAQRNVERASSSNDTALLRDPVGWQKERHDLYPTTDLNLVTDPFTPEARKYIAQKLDSRLTPLLERIFGVTPRAIRANDMFVVRYDAQERTLLDKHTDDSDISFNVLLSDDFEGGGTRFWHRQENTPFAHAQPQLGRVLTHSAFIQHEGMPVTNGVRHILVGFLAVDHVDALTGDSTGLSWFASWFSLQFWHCKLRDGLEATEHRQSKRQFKWSTDNKYVQRIFSKLVAKLEYMGDILAPHFQTNLVKEEDSLAYLKSLDLAFEAKRNVSGATWFRGQQVVRDVNGIMMTKWPTRAGNEEPFQDL